MVTMAGNADETGDDDAEADGLRKIIHVDMDAFFASVEQRDNPELRGKPVAVGGASGRGVVAAASYEARKFGVRSAMPSVTAKRLCPDLIFCKSRFDVYREVSQQIRAIFRHHTDLVEPLSLDEAYLDVTEDKLGIGSATRIAELIRQEIRAKTRLTASAGVSYNKFLAKLASDQNKPDGLCVIRPGDGAAFVQSLPVRRFHGVGPKGAEKMARLGIATGGDLAAKDIERLCRRELQQIPCQDRQRPEQARRAVRHPPGRGCGICQHAADPAFPWRRPQGRGEDGEGTKANQQGAFATSSSAQDDT